MGGTRTRIEGDLIATIKLESVFTGSLSQRSEETAEGGGEFNSSFIKTMIHMPQSSPVTRFGNPHSGSSLLRREAFDGRTKEVFRDENRNRRRFRKRQDFLSEDEKEFNAIKLLLFETKQEKLYRGDNRRATVN